MKVIKDLSRSVFAYRYPVKGSFNLGEICPIGAPIEVIPYDEHETNCAMVIRMATPIAPIMDDLDAEITAHFVPLRLISNQSIGDWTNQGYSASQSTATFEKIIANGLGNPADWMVVDNEIYTAPTATWNAASARSAGYTTIGEALGLGLGCGTSRNQGVLAYPLYGYNLIYQERFRNQDVEAAKANLGQGSNLYGASGTNTDTTGTDISYNHALSVAYKHGDFYTNGKPSPQKGAAVTIPLGDYALLDTMESVYEYDSGKPLDLWAKRSGTIDATDITPLYQQQTTGHLVGDPSQDTNTTDADLLRTSSYTNLVVDLKNATAATVNSFIEAYNIQRLLMRDIKGTRYFDIIKNHYGVVNDDIKLYIPELLNIRRFQINISPVVQQSGAATATSGTDQGNYLGTTGGYSFTANNGPLVKHAFGEFGYIYFLIVIRQRHTYGQGIPKMFLRSKRFDFFFPELGRIGYQAIKKVELNADEDMFSSTPNFAYQPAWQELRDVNQAQAFGFLNPNKSNSLDYWTLTDKLSTTPTLGMAFLKENRTNLARALTIADQGPDFIMDAIIYGKKSTLVPIGTEPKLFN